MKATLKRSELAAALRVGGKLSGPATLPVLGSVRIDVEDGIATLTQSDLEMTISQRLVAGDAEAGTVLVPADMLARVAGAVGTAEVRLVEDDASVAVTGGSTEAQLNSIDPAAWPLKGDALEVGGDEYKLASADLDGIERIAGMARNGRESYAGVHLDGAQAIATDSYRLGVVALSTDGIPPTTIPNLAVELMLASIKGDATLRVGPRLASLGDDRTTIVTRLLDAEQYPQLERILGTRSKATTTLTFDADGLAAALKRVGSIGVDVPVTITLEGDEAVVSAEVKDSGSITDRVDVEVDGPTDAVKRLSWNSAYLGEAIAAHGEDRFAMQVGPTGVPAHMESAVCRQILMGLAK